MDFYPRPPRGGRRQNSRPARAAVAISIHALREEGDDLIQLVTSPGHISIHALREEGDTPSLAKQNDASDFYPRPPRGGRRHEHIGQRRLRQFLSTPSARRATVALEFGIVRTLYFYPRPPRGGRPSSAHDQLGRHPISIHALREEGDTPANIGSGRPCDFYPRPPRGGRPVAAPAGRLYYLISIHALREEGDPQLSLPCSRAISFLSTPSARRAT